MNKLIALAFATAALATAPGCVVYSYDDDIRTDVIVYEDVNFAPEVFDGAAGVFFDEFAYDDVWYFDAAADDVDGPLDVVQVWADVYDEGYSPALLVASFELYPTSDPYLWTGEFSGFGTGLDPFYQNYTVDLVAYDSWDAWGALTVWADTY